MKGAHVFDAQFGHPIRSGHLVGGNAIVEHVLDRAVGHLHARANVGQPVELRADLADLGAEELVEIHEHVVLAEGAAGGRAGMIIAYVRSPNSGMPRSYIWPSSYILPVLTSWRALRMISAVMRLDAPAWSSAPHGEGHQGPCSRVWEKHGRDKASTRIAEVSDFMSFSLVNGSRKCTAMV